MHLLQSFRCALQAADLSGTPRCSEDLSEIHTSSYSLHMCVLLHWLTFLPLRVASVLEVMLRLPAKLFSTTPLGP